MGLYDKCRTYAAALRDLRHSELYPYAVTVEGYVGEQVLVEGEPRIMLGGNNYLGLARDPRVVEAAAVALREFGASLTGSRMLHSLPLHAALEREVAAFVGKPAAVVFPTGYQANVGALSSMCGPRDAVIVDEYVHASLLDGARLSGARFRSFRHNDPQDLARTLQDERSLQSGDLLVVVDGVYSMEGDVAALAEIVSAARCHGAAVLVDDAHGFGVLGPGGRGTCADQEAGADVGLITVTFSKSLASVGGAVLGDTEVIEYIRHHARAQIFSAAQTPADAAAALTALRIARAEPWRGERAIAQARRLARGLTGMGYHAGDGCSPIVPVRLSDERQVFTAWRALLDGGVYTNPIIPPAGAPRLRLSCSAAHPDEDVDQALRVFGRTLGDIAAASVPGC
ncbi:aminotransferase class I/II-fold pyridoxal phosphate-dependent enzyme [Streptomyces sp. CA-181903]|uniref:aminotransferase class I/II-fold pyridoxal phosphate-dependent enzyme n=1 Tax=Streptomyces sp. CA-181903 TaxID=3240055 RepID=UPI003D93C6A2